MKRACRQLFFAELNEVDAGVDGCLNQPDETGKVFTRRSGSLGRRAAGNQVKERLR